MKKIPLILIYSRLAFGLLMIVLSILKVGHYNTIAIVLLTTGLLTDILDGIIARQLNVSNQKLRRLDSSIDQAFFVSVAIATYLQCPEFFHSNAFKMIILLGSEGLIYLVCFIKFKKEIATHSIGAKMWTLILFATLVQIIMQCQSVLLFEICFWVGILTRIEIIAIVLTLKHWTNDVPSVFHAIKLRQGKEIKRNKLFNG